MPTVAEYLVEALENAGVERVYGLPGGENVEILDAMRKRGIAFVLVKNESSACFMAATEARLSGGIGVAITTLGPGATNAYAGLAHCHLDRAPVLLITAATDPDLFGRHSHQALDLGAVFRPICKFSAELSATNATARIQSALRVMRADRPGPVHLSLHNRIAAQQVAIDATPAAAASATDRASPSVDAIRSLLARAAKPIIVAGLGLEPEAPYAQAQRLAEALDAPVIDTPKSKGALAADHPLFAGTIGLTRSDPAYELLDAADCIIALGFDVVELVKPWDYEKPLLWIANWRNEDPRIHFDREYIGSISRLLEELGEIKVSTASDWGAKRVHSWRESRRRTPLPAPAPGRILPQDFLSCLRRNTPDDLLVTTDVGSHKIFAALEWEARVPNRYFVSNGLSAMGFGLSSAIAAAIVAGQPTVCITGDAGLSMVMGELSLLVERRLPVLVAVMNDGALDLIRSAQLRAGRPAFGTEFRNPDFAHIAAAYGLAYRRVDSRAGCGAALREWLADGSPMLLDVMIDPVSYPTTVRQPT